MLGSHVAVSVAQRSNASGHSSCGKASVVWAAARRAYRLRKFCCYSMAQYTAGTSAGLWGSIPVKHRKDGVSGTQAQARKSKGMAPWKAEWRYALTR